MHNGPWVPSALVGGPNDCFGLQHEFTRVSVFQLFGYRTPLPSVIRYRNKFYKNIRILRPSSCLDTQATSALLQYSSDTHFECFYQLLYHLFRLTRTSFSSLRILRRCRGDCHRRGLSVTNLVGSRRNLSFFGNGN